MIAYYDRLKPASPDFHLFLSVKQYLLGKSLHKDNSKVNSHFNAMFNGCLWTDAVLVISHLGFNWFRILDILHLQPSVNSNACEFYVQPTKEFKKNNCL